MRIPRAKTQRTGIVSRDWSATAPALITLDSGEVVEAMGGEKLRDLLTHGQAVVVYYDRDDSVLGWLLPEHNAGVNVAHRHET